MKIGFIGLGIMGSRMAANLQKSGYEIIVYNRSKDKADTLVKNGAVLADTPASAGEQSNIIITMLSTPDVVREMAYNENGFLNKMKPDSIWVNSSTISPNDTKEFGDEASKRNIRFVDAPVSGTKAPAENAQLIFLAGGNKKDIDEVTPLLEKMGKSIIYCGDTGSGSAMKMVVNLLLGQSLLAFCEALALGDSYGLQKDLLYNTLRNIPVTSPFLVGKSKKLEEREYEPEFPLQWMHKDLHLAAVSAYENHISLPVLNIVKEIYAMAVRDGFAEKDLTAVFEIFNKK